jgi:hypothetical protein
MPRAVSFRLTFPGRMGKGEAMRKMRWGRNLWAPVALAAVSCAGVGQTIRKQV